jgi:alpha-N-arabinofuranosidase
MKKLFSSMGVIVFLFTAFISCKQHDVSKARFDYFSYKGNDEIFQAVIDVERQYLNPILSGFYPDPSICRKGDEFYLVNSSFSFYPGIPIFASKDLANWEQIGHVLDRPSQLKLDSIRISGGIYAPAIAYNKQNDTFYLITTCVDGIGNFVVKTHNPRAGWSEPIHLPEVRGIDPSLFFDDDGKAYVIHNDAPEGEPQWDGHRAIWIHEYDMETDKTFGDSRVIIDGGVDKSQKPVWIEGPHLYKRNGKYLLIAAEGGTSVQHSQVAFISDSVFGPYVPFKENPMLTQRDLPEERADKITSVGHADLIEDIDGRTWAVFLGCRPYEGNYYNTGRETFLLPVEWQGDFPLILPKGKALPIVVDKKNLVPDNVNAKNFSWIDHFDKHNLSMQWLSIRTPHEKWYAFENEKLVLTAIPQNIYEVSQPAFLGYRQQHTSFETITKIEFQPESEQDFAGFACFQKETHNIVFGKTIENGKTVLVVDRCEKGNRRIAAFEIPNQHIDAPFTLKIKGDKNLYSFYASFDDGNDWINIAENVDGKNLSTESAGGFIGNIIGLYASSKKK